MNMLIRFFIMMALLRQQQKAMPVSPATDSTVATDAQLFAPIKQSHRILPHDMGWRQHLPNYRYLSFIELNVTHWLMEQCHYQGVDKLWWIISMQEVIYLKEVKLWDRLCIESMLTGWDDKYVYFEHQFFVNNRLMAVGMTKFILKDRKQLQLPSVLGMTGRHMTLVIDTWNAHQAVIREQTAAEQAVLRRPNKSKQRQ